MSYQLNLGAEGEENVNSSVTEDEGIGPCSNSSCINHAERLCRASISLIKTSLPLMSSIVLSHIIDDLTHILW